MKVLVFVFDGLRPDHINPALMPELARFASESVRFANARTVFPSETRVAVSSLVTGCRPGSHGIAANQFVDRGVFADRPVDTGARADLQAVRAAQGGTLLMRPSLSDRLHEAGLCHAVVSSASPGSSFLLDSNAASLGQFSWSVHGTGNTPDDLAAEILERYGPVPAATSRRRRASLMPQRCCSISCCRGWHPTSRSSGRPIRTRPTTTAASAVPTRARR
jgi:hypothetical protein